VGSSGGIQDRSSILVAVTTKTDEGSATAITLVVEDLQAVGAGGGPAICLRFRVLSRPKLQTKTLIDSAGGTAEQVELDGGRDRRGRDKHGRRALTA
jgi:hypothetical protein